MLLVEIQVNRQKHSHERWAEGKETKTQKETPGLHTFHTHPEPVCVKILVFHCLPVLLISRDHLDSDRNFYTYEATVGIKLHLLNFSKI